jgi:ethanolamine ammonia-lyase small subunit
MADEFETIDSREGGSKPQRSPVPVEGAYSALTGLRARTPARILTGRAGPAYRTTTWLDLRRDHAAAKDAVWDEFDLVGNLGAAFVAEWDLFEVNTEARTKQEFLLHPERGRRLADSARAKIAHRCPPRPVLQVALTDGLSGAALTAQVPVVLPLLASGAHDHGWQWGQPFFIHYGRVGVLNDIGEAIQPTVAVLLIGERPGLATAVSLSAYMAFRPCDAQNDANRNVISNIHADGVPPDLAAHRVIRLAALMIGRQASGVAVKELPFPVDSNPDHDSSNWPKALTT